MPPLTQTPTDIARTVRQAFESGITVPLDWRRGQLRALDRMLSEHSAEIEIALRSDLGKHPLESHLAEIGAVRTEITHTLHHLRGWTKPKKASIPLQLQPALGRIVRQPLGVVLIIAPWNYPIHLMLMPLVGALAAGNAVVLKPSELAPKTSALVARLMPQYLDQAAIRVVEGAVSETTELLANRWDHIFYTGNGAVGRVVMAAAATHLTPVTLELGGKSPTWVDDTADIDQAAEWLAWGKYLNAGQTCIAPDYILTTPDLAPRLAAALHEKVAALYSSTPRESADYGRIVNARHTQRLAGLLGSGRIVFGGDVDVDACYVAPTVLIDVDLQSSIMQEEIFGPILPIVTAADYEDAIGIINRGDKPLAMYVFTKSKTVREAFIERTTSGSMAINATMIQLGADTLPFGGVGASGFGAYHGEHSIRVFSHERAVLRRLPGPNLTALARPPFTPKKERMLRSGAPKEKPI